MSRSPELLDDVAALDAGDRGEMLRAVASGAAQVREAARLTAEAGVDRLADDGRPRAVLVCGAGGSAVAGDVLAAVAGDASPVPVVVSRGPVLPAWAGPMDLVVAVSCSGSTRETLSALEEAVRRGCRLMVVGRAGSPLDDLGQRGRAVFVPVPQGRPSRASLWALSTPLVLAGHALGLLSAPPQDVEQTASLLEQVADRCRRDADHLVNPGKRLAAHLDGALPVVWGTSAVTGVAAARFALQLNENAEVPAVWGLLPDAAHNQAMVLEGPAAPRVDAAGDPDDFFRDRADDVEQAGSLALVVLRDSDEHPQTAAYASSCLELAREQQVPVLELHAEGRSPLARLASLVGLVDFASTYLALLQGTDPTPVRAVERLRDRAAQVRPA
ncbi:MAG: Putative regulator of the mannose operon, ManO [uncultured Frankineae bacterium]|uniref:Regulator of the mannose operon, ManO n=1 Tax=uncultured Frankineae bacterium TaxID=437475 RepID=A0A6J4LF87_9ACTN|nr:MAG: Putative regulator of the mannose operon, ManO [uncultured Frankineae bacterium]